jgi:hypothetical protein
VPIKAPAGVPEAISELLDKRSVESALCLVATFLVLQSSYEPSVDGI